MWQVLQRVCHFVPLISTATFEGIESKASRNYRVQLGGDAD